MRCQTALDCISRVPFPAHGGRVFVHGACATPHRLLAALVESAERFRGLELIHLHTHGPARYAARDMHRHFRVANLFVAPNMRPLLDGEAVDYLPLFLSEIPALFRSRRRPLDVALLHLSPPDAHGYCTLGMSVDVALAAAESAPYLIAEINHQMPRVHGAGVIHISRLAAYVEVHEPIDQVAPTEPNPLHDEIARYVAQRIEDGATLQMGIGAVPDAVLRALVHHRHLGIHTEMFADGVVDLITTGAVDNSRKTILRGQTAASFVMGSRRLIDFVNDNPAVSLHCASFINDTRVIRKNPKVTAINSAVEIDLTGQICADSVGPRIISGVGGQMDFMRGASLSEGGKPIIALTARTDKGHPRIVPELAAGAGVVTTRGHVHYVATEYGIVDLYGKTLGERARALTSIAHPDDREGLAKAWADRLRRAAH